MTTNWEGDGRREVMQELAEQADSEGEHFFYVRIPGDIQPLERADRFEEPLDAELERADLGSVTGGGSQLGEGTTIEYCGIDVVVADRRRGLEVIRSVLQGAGCPKDAVIEEYVPEYDELPVWPGTTLGS